METSVLEKNTEQTEMEEVRELIGHQQTVHVKIIRVISVNTFVLILIGIGMVCAFFDEQIVTGSKLLPIATTATVIIGIVTIILMLVQINLSIKSKTK